MLLLVALAVWGRAVAEVVAVADTCAVSGGEGERGCGCLAAGEGHELHATIQGVCLAMMEACEGYIMAQEGSFSCSHLQCMSCTPQSRASVCPHRGKRFVL